MAKSKNTPTPEIPTYDGSIVGTDLAEAVEEQRTALWQAQAIIDSVAHAIEREYGADWLASVPCFPLALRTAARMIDETTARLEPMNIELRGMKIAQERAARAAGVPHA